MSNREETGDELTGEERRALRALRDRPVPAGGEEEAVLRALRKRGLVGRGGRRSLRRPVRYLAAAAVLALTFLAGARYGSERAERAPVPTPRETRFAVAEARDEAMPTFDEYRDEPDRPGRGASVYPKMVAE